jgi:hypothetical protein
MFLIQFLLPLYDNDGQGFPRAMFDAVREELTGKFGGVTAYLRSPAQGFWKESGDEVVKDDLVIYEVMTEELDREWWWSYREQLAQTFRQEEILIRASEVQRL